METESAPVPAKKPNLHLPPAPKSPVRFAIRGMMDTLPGLKEFVRRQDIDPDLITYLISELDELDSNAATISLHCVEQPEGGFDLHLSVRPVHLGAPKG